MTGISAFAAAKARLSEDKSPANGRNGSYIDQSEPYTSEESDSDRQTTYHEVKTLPRQQLSTWIPGKRAIAPSSAEDVTIQLKHHERATFMGCYDLTVSTGAVEVAGAVLCPSSARHRVFAVTSSSIPSIQCKTRECSITLRNCSDGLQQIEKVSSLFSRVVCGDSQDTPVARSFKYLQWSDEAGVPVASLETPREWISAFERLVRHDSGTRTRRSRAEVFVCGTQKCGKSTFCRMLINHAITRDALQRLQADNFDVSDSGNDVLSTAFLLDLDPGQPELSPPGQISLAQIASPLLGPPLSHPTCYGLQSYRIVRSHTIANSTPQDDIEHFLACCHDLIQTLDRTHREFPTALVVINTPGWITALGLDLMTDLMRATAHNQAVIMGLDRLRVSDEERREVHDTLCAASKGTPAFITGAQVPSAVPSRTPAELRAMQYQSYFHLKEPRSDQARWSGTPLNSGLRTPLTLNFSQSSSDVLGLVSVFETPAQAYIAPWIHRNVIALCLVEDAQLAQQMHTAMTRTAREGLPHLGRRQGADSNSLVPPDPAKTRYLGLAYVKDIDAEAQRMALVTPIVHLVMSLILEQQHSMDRTPRLFLVAGKFETPHWAYAEDALWEKSSRKRAGDEELDDGRRPYVRRLRQGEKADLVWRAGATARFARKD